MEMTGIKEVLADLSKEDYNTLFEIWEDYELRQSKESQFVKDLDVLEMISQAFEYEK